jgi:hypothetical protein
MSTNLWLVWGQVAIDATSRGISARQAGSLGDETRESLVAVCAAAFAVEAASRSLPRNAPPAVLAAEELKERAAKTAGVLREVLKASLVNGKLANDLADRWEPVIELRGNAVHYTEVLGPTAPHPSGVHTSLTATQYTTEQATSAVELLLETLGSVIKAPKPAAKEWAASATQAVEALVRRWRQA